MAINSIDYIPPTVTTGSKGKKGGAGLGTEIGAGIGTVVGGVAGGMAGAAAGGIGVPLGVAKGAAEGASLGAGAGGIVGNWVDPAKASTEAISRRIDNTAPKLIHSDQSNQLRDSLVALQSQPDHIQQALGPQLQYAYLKSVANDNPMEA